MESSGIFINGSGESTYDEIMEILKPLELTAHRFRGYRQAASYIDGRRPDFVIMEVLGDFFPGALRFVGDIRQHDRYLPLLMIVKNSSEQQVLSAFRAGVTDYFTVPLCYDTVVSRLRKHLKVGESAREGFPAGTAEKKMVGESEVMKKITEYIQRAACTDATVLITGDTGTGKELAARMIHENSPRHRGPMVCINCAALPENLVESELFGFEKGAYTGASGSKIGKFEMAGEGTVFLDEIGDMTPHAQAKILRTIETGEVCRLGGKTTRRINVRILAATNKNPEDLVSRRAFRNDLFFRLNVARIHLPPLRDRKEDIPRLVDFTIEELNRRFHRSIKGVTKEAMGTLIRYDWPGNIRELRNLLEAGFVNLPPRSPDYLPLPELFLDTIQRTGECSNGDRDRVLNALFSTNWNKSKAAEKLNWSRMTLYRKMAKYNITKSPVEPFRC